MALIAAYIVPHPPLAVPEVGRGEENKISDTLAGYRTVAERIASLRPETIVIISPHTAYYADWIYIANGSGASGDLAQFRAPRVKVGLTYDAAFREALIARCQRLDIPAGCTGAQAQKLDHGMIVPLYYLDQVYPASRYDAVSIGGSALDANTLVEFGAQIAAVAHEMDKRTVLLVSGDLSHKLLEEGPYGFDPAGPAFDQEFVRIVTSGKVDEFAALDADMCEQAAECGLSGFVMMAGALHASLEQSGLAFTSELISYEGPFGVGYGVAAFERADAESVSADGAATQLEADDGDTFDEPASLGQTALASTHSSDPLVQLACSVIDQYVRHGMIPEAPELPCDAPQRAGCFVSIHVASSGELRGCIGTIEPTQPSLAREIVANAISASTRDPRFPAISSLELDDLIVNVDVLFPPEPCTFDMLDPKRYGVIVTQGFKRGLLLPDLEGVGSAEEQVRIASMKAGIRARSFDDIELERFEVVRHT